LLADIDAAFADSASHAVVLLGSDNEFCRGLDLGRASQDEDATAALKSFTECLRKIRTGTKPAIALVRGVAVGGGVGLAAACDGVLATTDATFAQTELLFGLIPAIVLPYLAQRVMEQKLRWIALRAQPLTAAQALEIGLADQVCEPADAHRVLRHWTRQMQRIQPPAVAMWKRAVNAGRKSIMRTAMGTFIGQRRCESGSNVASRKGETRRRITHRRWRIRPLSNVRKSGFS
jgi:enoyl-CoA hydratase/carnithine racemase